MNHPAPCPDRAEQIRAALGVRVGYSLRWRLLARRLGPVPPVAAFVAARLAGDAISPLAPVGRGGGDPVRIGLLYGTGVGGTQAGAGVASGLVALRVQAMSLARVRALWWTSRAPA